MYLELQPLQITSKGTTSQKFVTEILIATVHLPATSIRLGLGIGLGNLGRMRALHLSPA